MARALVLLALLALVGSRGAWGFVCNYPVQRLTGLAFVADESVVKLDLAIKLSGPECVPVAIGGRFRCQRVGSRTLGVRFTRSGRCPGTVGQINGFSYAPRVTNVDADGVADVEIDGKFTNGTICAVSGVSPAAQDSLGTIGGPLPAVFGQLLCTTPSGEITAKGPVQLLRLPLPRL
jgi:hypothetical protein